MPLPDDAADPGVDGTDPRGEVIYNRLLERMAVPSAAVEEVRQELLAEFKKNSLHYLAAGDFPAKLAARRDGQQKDVRKRYTGILD